ncbi:MAG: 23S rRNA (guanosine(2251)-2'-O)-methyltransferase RlmB [Bacteroidales bacterium]
MSKESLIYGLRPVLEALRSGAEIDKLLFQTGLRGELYHEVMSMLREKEIPYQLVPVQKLNRITTKNHQGVIAFISPVTYYQPEQLIPRLYEEGKTPFILILDRITDVRNFGALCRTAEAAGVHAIIFPSRGSAALHEDAVKTSAGALLRIPLCRSQNLKTTLEYLKDSGLKLIGVTEKTQILYSQEDYTLPLGLLLGSEEDGISPAYLRYCDSAVRIPMMGEIESLNVSVAGGIVMFEAVTQRLKTNL